VGVPPQVPAGNWQPVWFSQEMGSVYAEQAVGVPKQL
jgi:hypothetical protein